MDNYINLAKKFSANGFSVIPVTSEKLPAIGEWGIYQTRPMTEEECEKHFSNCWGIALLCGGKKKLTGLDGDFKYDIRKDAFDRFKEAVPTKILKKLYLQETKNNGIHLIFSCNKIEPNQKLASRHTTSYEKHETYLKSFNNVHTRENALKIALNDRSRVIWETRGGTKDICGGYVVMAPSPGYKHIYGKIQEITEDEYDLLLSVVRSQNEVTDDKKERSSYSNEDWEINPFEDYNSRGDIISLLEEHGWENIDERYGNVRFKRPGAVNSQSSALFDTESRKFTCFSTSTLFDVNKGYQPATIFRELECGGDGSEAFKKLIDLGYGKKK